jgi:hypothetical protein
VIQFGTLPFACGLAFDIERSSSTKSGFRPAKTDMGSHKELFADLRLEGFAALLRLGFAEKLTIFGGDEGRYKVEIPGLNRAWAIKQMLVDDHGIAATRIEYVRSNSNTGGNVVEIKKRIGFFTRSAVVSNHYHLPRAALDLRHARIRVPLYPAEAFLLLENHLWKHNLIKRFGGNALAERMVEEIQGIADKIRGTYRPRTDIAAVSKSSRLIA